MSKANKAKDLSINTLLFTISNFGTKIISFLLVPLYTYVLSTKDYGKLDLVTTTVQLLVPILTLNIQDAVLRYCLDKEYNPLQVVKTGLRVAVVSSVILGLGLLLVYSLPVFKLSIMYSVYLYFLFIANVFNNTLSMYLKAVNKVKLLVVCGLLNTLLTCSLNIILLLVIKLGVLGYLIANISGTMFSIILMMLGSGLLKEKTDQIPKGLFKSMSLYSLPLVANSVAWWLNNASDRYILAFFCGAAVNGIYAVAYKIPTILSTVQSVFYNAWSISAITEFDEDDTDGFIGNVYMTYSCVSLVGCSILLIFNMFLARILYAKEFFAAWQFVPPLLVGTVFNGIALFEGCIFTAVKNTKSVSITTILGAIVNTICNFALIPFIGALGASIATMVGYIAIWIIRTVQMNKIIKIKAQWNAQIMGMIMLIFQCVIALVFKQFYWQLPIAILVVISHKSYLEKVFAIVKRKMIKEKL
ncbi:oligosaccharide flippase family protein [Ruminococcus sp. HUN007]|uniref:lipopolysaccharide biosynthesis protein n=1 Tax=Ruminococcus sp. HUN007 TaxID=1514668 RepID=UPI0005D29C68|nr:oligosaccharide flippase family protein [Ruminococcus sp. HUN007]